MKKDISDSVEVLKKWYPYAPDYVQKDLKEAIKALENKPRVLSVEEIGYTVTSLYKSPLTNEDRDYAVRIAEAIHSAIYGHEEKEGGMIMPLTGLQRTAPISKIANRMEEIVVSMVEFKGNLYLATQHHIYKKIDEVWKPMEIMEAEVQTKIGDKI